MKLILSSINREEKFSRVHLLWFLLPISHLFPQEVEKMSLRVDCVAFLGNSWRIGGFRGFFTFTSSPPFLDFARRHTFEFLIEARTRNQQIQQKSISRAMWTVHGNTTCLMADAREDSHSGLDFAPVVAVEEFSVRQNWSSQIWTSAFRMAILTNFSLNLDLWRMHRCTTTNLDDRLVSFVEFIEKFHEFWSFFCS